MGEHRRLDVGLEARQAAPEAAIQAETPFQIGDARLDAGAETLELPVQPRRAGHVLGFQAAFLVEHDMLDAQRLGLLEILARGVTAVESRPRRRRAVLLDVPLEHRQASADRRRSGAVRRVAVLHHHVEHQPGASRGQVDLVPVMRAAAALDDNVRMRLEQAHYLLASRHRLAAEHPPFGLLRHPAQQIEIGRRAADPRAAPRRARRRHRRQRRLDVAHRAPGQPSFR